MICLNTRKSVVLLFVLVAASSFVRPLSNHSEVDKTRVVSVEKLSPDQRKHIENKILALLGLDHPPKPDPDGTKEVGPASKYMLSLYKAIVDHKDWSGSDDIFWRRLSSADTVMSFADDTPFSHFLPPWNSTIKVHFDLSELKPSDNLIGAHVRIFINTRISNMSDQINIHLLLSHSDFFDRKENSFMVGSQKVPESFRGWVNIDATKIVQEWKKFPSRNNGLIIRAVNQLGKLVEPLCMELAGQKKKSRKKRIFLVVMFKTGEHEDIVTSNRKKRSTSNKGSPSNQEPFVVQRSYTSRKLDRCQRMNLYISFKDFEWEWVIAPEGYYAYYCYGDCTFPLHAHMNATNHAIIQTLVHLMNPNNVPKPCCAPTKLNSLPVLYHDNTPHVILKKYRNMVVKACGCH